ncbi:MAG: GHKL domain-containing protein [Proteobacteria bacterium]|nr:GHKL domain-containing protein [Pseudomonadota bacterium]
MFAVGIGVRAALLGAIAFAILELLVTQHLYATAIVLSGLAALLLLDLARYVSRGDRMLARFVEALAAGELEHPARGMTGFQRLQGAIERAVATLDAARLRPQQQIDHLQTLIDIAPIAIITLDDTGKVSLANHAARRLAGRAIGKLEHLSTIGIAAREALLELAPGQRRVVRIASGQRVLASAARFCAGGRQLRVFSLQNIGGELDAVELQAWQDLLRVLAHEMMNSLTPISSLAQSVRPLLSAAVESDPNGRLRDVADAIDVIARRSSGLMNFVARYRTMAELPPPSLEPLPVADFLRRIDQLMQPTLAARGIAYSSRVEPPELTLRADGGLLEQVLINLIHNAMEAFPAPQTTPLAPSIEVRCQLRDDHCLISVSDNGKGLESGSLEHIFVPFFTTKPGGSGIGLSLARQIAHAHRGQLEAASNEPQGAVFTLSIPAPTEAC